MGICKKARQVSSTFNSIIGAVMQQGRAQRLAAVRPLSSH